MNNLAIIPARGGSKGIPHKNIVPLCGKPLLAWSIQSAQKSQSIDRIIVSTDDEKIGEVARQYGAEVVWRPDELSTDNASSESALLHTLEYLQDKEEYEPEIVVFLQCTSPLTTAQDIDNAVQKLYHTNADSVFSVTDFHYFLWQESPDGQIVGLNHSKNQRLLRQERTPQWLETGAIYAFRTKGFIQARHRFFGKTVMSYMPPERCWEIDEPVDLLIADVLLRNQLRKENLSYLPDKIEAVVFDFDGVMTDNKVLVGQDGRESVLCHRGDGWGIEQLKKLNIKTAIMSTERNPVVSARSSKLGLESFQGLGASKEEKLKDWCQENKISYNNLVFVGNDTNDVASLQLAACGVVPADAHSSVLPYADIILNYAGGQGAVRELCDLIVEKFKQD